MEDWKIKISVLWLFASIAFLAHQILLLMEPGIIENLMAGEAEGQKIVPELILFFAMGWGTNDVFSCRGFGIDCLVCVEVKTDNLNLTNRI